MMADSGRTGTDHRRGKLPSNSGMASFTSPLRHRDGAPPASGSADRKCAFFKVQLSAPVPPVGKHDGVQEGPGPPTQSQKDQGRRCGDSIVEEKERLHQLECSLKNVQKDNCSLRKGFDQLREAFHCNLTLLEEHKQELQTYHLVLDRALRMEGVPSNVFEEIQKHVDKCDQMKLELQHKRQDVEDVARQREVKLLSKESDFYCWALQASLRLCQRLHGRLQLTFDQISTITATTNSRMKKLEEECEFLKRKLEDKNDQITKLEEVVVALQAMNVLVTSQCEAQTEQLNQTEDHIVGLKEGLDQMSSQAQRVQEVLHQKDIKTQRFFNELEETRSMWDKQVSEMMVKNVEVMSLQQRTVTLSRELERSREQTLRYKHLLTAGLSREKHLDQLRVSLELDWMKRFENFRTQHLLDQDHLIQTLIQAREQAEAELKLKEEEAKELNVRIHSVQSERDHALHIGEQHAGEHQASGDVQRLQEQNQLLRAVVSTMKEEMQTLNQLLQTRVQPPTSDITASQHTGHAPSCEPVLVKLNAVTQTCACDHLASANAKQQVNYVESSGPPCHGRGRSRGRRGDAPPLLRRLKQAVTCIARLTAEKQQLIQMGNRLRAQTTPPDPADSVEPQGSSSRTEPPVQKNNLWTLEQLQYQLTTQELEYALKQSVCTVAEPLHQCRGAVPPPILLQRNQSLEISKQIEPHPESSEDSLKDLWDLLDHGLSFSTFSEDFTDYGT